MKFEITKTIGKLFTVVALAAVLAGTALALPVRQFEKKDSEKSVNWSPDFGQIEMLSLKKATSGSVSETNQANFKLGHYLMRTIYDAYFAKLEESEMTDVAEDIEVLLEFFKGTPEQAKLEELLKAVNAGMSDVDQVAEVISSIEKNYRAELSEEEEWFLLYGEWTTCLIGDTHLEDDEYIFEDLAVLQEMAAEVPVNVNKEIIQPVGAMSRFSEQDSFSTEDYEEILSNAFNIFDLVFGE